MKTLVAWLALAAAVAHRRRGCNTVEGAGKDVKAAGGAIEKAAREARST